MKSPSNKYTFTLVTGEKINYEYSGGEMDQIKFRELLFEGMWLLVDGLYINTRHIVKMQVPA